MDMPCPIETQREFVPTYKDSIIFISSISSKSMSAALSAAHGHRTFEGDFIFVGPPIRVFPIVRSVRSL